MEGGCYNGLTSSQVQAEAALLASLGVEVNDLGVISRNYAQDRENYARELEENEGEESVATWQRSISATDRYLPEHEGDARAIQLSQDTKLPSKSTADTTPASDGSSSLLCLDRQHHPSSNEIAFDLQSYMKSFEDDPDSSLIPILDTPGMPCLPPSPAALDQITPQSGDSNLFSELEYEVETTYTASVNDEDDRPRKRKRYPIDESSSDTRFLDIIFQDPHPYFTSVNYENDPPQKRQNHPIDESSSDARSSDNFENLESQLYSDSVDSDCSADFETNSTWSGGQSDWGEDDIDIPQIFDHVRLFGVATHDHSMNDAQSPGTSVPPLLTPMKRSLVDSIMQEFWVIFNQEWSANIRKHSGDSPQSTYSSVSQRDGSSENRSSNGWRKRGRDDEEDEKAEDNNGKRPKRPKIDSLTPDSAEEKIKFACPYRKHSPRIYCHQNRRWRSCALTPLDTIARVKGHLYRYHRIFQCPRCKILQNSAEDLETHTLAVKACELSQEHAIDGITSAIEKKLRSRKKTHQGQSESDRWREIYRILFPTEGVPSPYFEPIQDDIMLSPDSEELTSYEEYSRRELPRLFQSALEAAIADEVQPIEERLRSQLVGMIQDCQDRLFSTYRARRSTDELTPTCGPPGSPSSPSPLVQETSKPTGDVRNGIIETLYNQVPPDTSLFCRPDVGFPGITSDPSAENAPSDSGYVSEPPMLKSDTSKDTLASESTTGSSSEGQQSQAQKISDQVQQVKDNYPPSSSQEVSMQQMYGYDFQDMTESQFAMNEIYPYDGSLEGFEIEKCTTLNGVETEEAGFWSELDSFK